MTKLDEILHKIDTMNERLFIGQESFQNRITVLEESVRNCQKMAKDRNDGFFRIKMAVISAVLASIFSLVVSWIKK